MLNAVLFVPTGHGADRWLMVCAEYAARYRYQVAAIATDWDSVMTMIRQEEAQVVVVARRDHLPEYRTPRLEVVTEVQTAPAAQHPDRRPRRTRAKN
jgi:hypothetical protein